MAPLKSSMMLKRDPWNMERSSDDDPKLDLGLAWKTTPMTTRG